MSSVHNEFGLHKTYGAQYREPYVQTRFKGTSLTLPIAGSEAVPARVRTQ